MMTRKSASRQSAKTSVSSPSTARIALNGVSTFARTIDAVERLVAGGADGPRSARRRRASAWVSPSRSGLRGYTGRESLPTSPRRSPRATPSRAQRSTSAAASTTGRSRRGGRPAAAEDDEPPRAGRRRDRDREDAHAAADRRAALRARRPRVRRRLQGRPRRGCASRAGASERPAAERMKELGPRSTSRAGSRSSSSRSAAIGPGAPGRAAVTDFGAAALAKVLGSNDTRKRSLALVFRFADDARAAARRPRGPARGADLPRQGGRGRGEADSESSAGSRARRSACLLRARRARSRTAAAPSSSASPQFEIADAPARTTPEGRRDLSCLELAAVQDEPRRSRRC